MQPPVRPSLRLEKRTITLLLSLIALLSMMLAGCGGSAGQSNITLTVLEDQNWVKAPTMELAKKFETQTGIHIDFQIIPDATYFQVLSTKLSTGNGPDIFGGQSGVSDLKVNYHVETNAVDLVERRLGVAGRPKRACPGDRRRQGVRPGNLGHLQRLLGHRL